MRVGVVMVAFVVTGVWAWISIVKNELQPWSAEMVLLVLGCWGAKAAQRQIEGNKPKTKQTDQIV